MEVRAIEEETLCLFPALRDLYCSPETVGGVKW